MENRLENFLKNYNIKIIGHFKTYEEELDDVIIESGIIGYLFKFIIKHDINQMVIIDNNPDFINSKNSELIFLFFKENWLCTLDKDSNRIILSKVK